MADMKNNISDINKNNTQPQNNNGETQESSNGKLKPAADEDYGFNFFPERDTMAPIAEEKESKNFIFKAYSRRRGRLTHLKCQKNVIWCTENDPLVKLMLRALKSKGCDFTLSRHVSCEKCNERTNGGYDPNTNQLVVCENNTRKSSTCCSVVAHELTHAFDNCRAKLDFTNLEHLACTEIRASNFTHCSFGSAVVMGEAVPWNYKEAHQACVKTKALQSVCLVRNVPIEKAKQIVESVFDKCYNDLEPVGRRPRKYTADADLSLIEGEMYGYKDRLKGQT